MMVQDLALDLETQRGPAPPLPVLVIISGMPATGKSTLATQLAGRLGWPVFTKDTFKEVLFDAAGHDEAAFDETGSDLIGAQSIALLLTIADALVAARGNVVLEGNFRADLAARDLARFLPIADLRLVYCDLDTPRILERYEQRLDNDERHPVHVDTGDADALAADLEAKDYGPIPLPVPTLIVRTVDGFDPPLEAIVAFCQR
jgi:predicted kinase